MQVKELSQLARNASYTLSALPEEQRNAALKSIQQTLKARAKDIFEQNKLDCAQAEEEKLAFPLLKRLKFDEGKLKVLIGKRVFRVSAYEIVLFLALPLLLIDGIAHGSVGAAAVAGIPLLSLLLANELTVNRRIADSASELLLFSSIPTASYGVIRYALDRAAGRTAEKFASCFFTDFGARTGYIRAVSTFGDPDAFAAFLLVTILLALVDLSDKGRSRASRAAAALVLLLNATAFVLTFSHGAWLALLLCAAVRPIYRSEKPVKFLSLPLMFLPAAVYLLPAGAVSDFLARAGLSAAPIERRRAAIADVLARLKNNLLLGEGDASFLADNATLSGATAPLFLQLILSVGLPITLLFLLFLVHRTHQLNRFRRYIRPSSMYAPALSASLALFALFAFGSCVYLFFDSTILYLFCVICGIGEAALRIGRTEAAERDFYGVENSEDAAVADIEIG